MDDKFRRILILIVTAATTALCVIILITLNLLYGDSASNHITSSLPSLDHDTEQLPTTPTTPAPSDQPNSPTPSTPEEPPLPAFVDLQPTLDQWAATLTATEQAGVMIYDLTNARVAASLNADQVFNVASVYKLLFAYDGYQQIALGIDNPDSIFARTSDRGNLTLSQCLDLTIRESYNGCADRLASNPNRAKRVRELISSLEMSRTSSMGLQSTVSDLTKLLRFYWQHSDLPAELWAQLSDSMLHQPPTKDSTHPLYDWRQGLPAGFSDQVNVYNKVGWDWNGEYWNVYADAAILEFLNDGHIYTIAVLTKNFASANKISRLGAMIEAAVTTQTQ